MEGAPWRGEPIAASEEALYAAYPGYREQGLAEFGPDRIVFKSDAGPILEGIYKTPVHSDDVWVLTPAKCGTTWMSELTWLVANNCDFTAAQQRPLSPERSHFLDFPVLMSPQKLQAMGAAGSRMLAPLGDKPRPWHVHTHLPLSMLPPTLLDTCKVIFVARNPKDTAVSFYKMMQLNGTIAPETTVNQFAELYTAGRCITTPFFPGVLQAWRQRRHPNMLFVTFEQMKQDLLGVIGRVAAHLGKELTKEQLGKLEQHLSFSSMKDNPAVNKEDLGYKKPDSASGERRAFMRKGQTGDWRNHLSPEVARRMDQWMEESLRGTGLQFVTDLPEQPERKQS